MQPPKILFVANAAIDPDRFQKMIESLLKEKS